MAAPESAFPEVFRVDRYLLTCEAPSSVKEEYAFAVFERLFQERGLPGNMRSDNGVPFASPHALFHLSKVAVWWLRLGIGMNASSPAIRSKTAANPFDQKLLPMLPVHCVTHVFGSDPG
jgi:hypothetical protein